MTGCRRRKKKKNRAADHVHRVCRLNESKPSSKTGFGLRERGNRAKQKKKEKEIRAAQAHKRRRKRQTAVTCAARVT